MIRVLHIMGCSDAGGISSVVLNYYRNIDRTKIRFDIALTISTVGQNGKALQELGATIHYLPLKSDGMKAFTAALEALLKTEKYDAVHVHESETCYVALMVAKKLGVPCRIAHSHTSSPWEGWKGELRRLSGILLNYPVSTHVIGCGQMAGERVFGKWNMRRSKALVLPNAVDTKKFAFSELIRDEVRRELQVEDKYVIGMVGRLSEEKNFPFALDLFAVIQKEQPDCVLLIAGNGDQEKRLRKQIVTLGIEDNVKMLGRRADVERLCQAFDVYILPSFHEGFPISVLEALASGLPAIVSDTVPHEFDFASAIQYLPLNEPETWIAEIMRYRNDTGRMERQHEPGANGYDIRDTAGILEAIYSGQPSEKKNDE